MIARSAALLCLLAACPGTPRSAAGRTKEAPVAVAMDRTPLEIDVDSPPGPPPHWYRVTLAMPSYLRADVPEFDASAFETQVLRPDGTESFGNDALTGPVLVRVTGDLQPYRLHLTATTPPAPRETRGSANAEPPPCDLREVDPANPRCANVVSCNANRPDFRNAACCLGCSNCSAAITAIEGTTYGWLPLGARQGITKGYRGTVAVLGNGVRHELPVAIIEVERDRSKIWLAGPPDFPIDDPQHAADADLRPPADCDWYYQRYRDR